MLYKALVLSLSLLFSGHVMAKGSQVKSYKLASKVVSVQSMHWDKSKVSKSSGMLQMKLVNLSERTHFIDAVYSPISPRVQLKRMVGKEGAQRMRSAYMVRLNPTIASNEGMTNVHVKLSGLPEPMIAPKALPLVLLFRDGSRLSVNMKT